jgi:hypothetical protein
LIGGLGGLNFLIFLNNLPPLLSPPQKKKKRKQENSLPVFGRDQAETTRKKKDKQEERGRNMQKKKIPLIYCISEFTETQQAKQGNSLFNITELHCAQVFPVQVCSNLAGTRYSGHLSARFSKGVT